MSGIAIDVAALAGLVCEGILFGIFLCLVSVTLHILLRRRHTSRLNWPMIVASATMLSLATAQICVDTANIFDAYINLDRAERQIFLGNATLPIFAAKHAIYFTTMLVGDVIVIYRCYVVWGHKIMFAVFPSLLSLGSAVSAYQTIWATQHIADVTVESEDDWGYAMFALSLGANSIATSLIAYRIYVSDRALSNFAKSRTATSNLFPIFKIILESGVTNAAYLLTYIVLLALQSHAVEIMACISTPLVGIIFSTVIVRAGLEAERNGSNALPYDSRVPMPSAVSRSHGVEVTTQWTVHEDAEALDMTGLRKMGKGTMDMSDRYSVSE